MVDLLLVFNSEEQLKILSSKSIVKLGTDLELAVGPFGRNLQVRATPPTPGALRRHSPPPPRTQERGMTAPPRPQPPGGGGLPPGP